jgi:hypothetical protein
LRSAQFVHNLICLFNKAQILKLSTYEKTPDSRNDYFTAYGM